MLRTLHAGWTLSGRDLIAIPATVPGSVHTDLLAAGLIDDPYLDDNETRLGWIGRTDWTYTTGFHWRPEGFDRVDLVFDGLDTVAEIELNGTAVGRTVNMHRRHRFDVTGVIRDGANTLRVTFTAPYTYAGAEQQRLGARPGPYAEPYQFIRKMACNFGWDWGPTLVTAGIWRPVTLHSWSGARLASVRPQVRADGVDVTVEIERAGTAGGAVAVAATVDGTRVEAEFAAGQDTATLSLDVPDARLWWPRGYGEQHLYGLTVTAADDVWTRRIGLRTVQLEPDAFRIVVNGEPVFVRGFNWIPDDCFPARTTAADLETRFGQAIGAGANALRVWGGGVYESEDFYDLADRLGLLVWQDFPFACAAYPDDLADEVDAEARDNVERLMPHPSLVLWCGNNENIEGFQHWGWPAELDGRSWGARLYHEVLPRVVAALDPGRPYWPGSPYSGSPEHDVHDASTGTVHIWTVWGSADYTHYADYTPRFVAEFGFQGPPAYATLRAAVTDDPLTPDSPGVRHHQKATGGNDKLLRGLGAHLPTPTGFDDWHYLTQLNQARAVSFGVQRFRALMPYCMGTVIWQLNDCWPVTSWAAVDGAGRRKPLWYELRRAYADRMLTFQPGGVTVVNDHPTAWNGPLRVDRRALDGAVLATHTAEVSVPPRATREVPLPPSVATAGNPRGELLTATLDGAVRAVRCFAEDPEMAYPPAGYTGEITAVPGGYAVTVTATTVLRELALFPDRLHPDATVSDQLVTLLPGESATFTVTAPVPLPAAALLTHPVLRCVNEPAAAEVAGSGAAGSELVDAGVAGAGAVAGRVRS